MGEALAREDIVLDTVTVSATREDAAPVEQMSSTSVVNAEVLERIQPDTVADVLQSVPGVTTSETGDDTASAINIRGLQDFGRVNVMIDGARQNFQRSGHNADGSFYLEPELIKDVTVIRGPVANVFGSGAIGGVVAFETIDPFEFLRPGERFAFSSKGQLTFNADGFVTSNTAAAGADERFGIIANITYRDQDDYHDGDGTTVPSEREVLAGFGKVQWRINEDMELKVGYVGNRADYVSGVTATPRQNDVADDTATGRFTWDPVDNPFVNLTVNSYWTRTDAMQTEVGSGDERFFNLETVGFDAYNTSEFFSHGFDQAVTFGIDAFHDRVTTQDLNGTGSLFTPSGEREIYGGFVQYELERGTWLDVVAALRFDAYDLSGETLSGAVENSGNRVSPKITLGLSPFEEGTLSGFQVYGTYAEGYRAPAVTETFVSGLHPPFSPMSPATFQFIPNPDLQPEVGKTFEIGVNYKRDNLWREGDALRVKAAIFHNNVEDFIEAQAVPPFGFPIVFNYQYVNVANAELNGAEFEATYDTGRWFASLAASMVRGENSDTGDYLYSLPADKVATTFGVRFLEERLTLGATWIATAAQDRVPPPDPTTGSLIDPSEAYNVVNLFATYEANENFSMGAAIDNVFDEQYRPYLNQNSSAGIGGKVWLKVRFGA
ncbi:TonB-dependent hemoglobin/transferrin/lactoferrin family receptor [Tepidamorphus sp. 3E244]|uniref:TonB-dependent hemoglobin/transferrin/lactoferrin family receptor n=1 Tax=Tepidamorphus sp. 3E244 TaxID=3385498 RepID=UPI0038FCC65F